MDDKGGQEPKIAAVSLSVVLALVGLVAVLSGFFSGVGFIQAFPFVVVESPALRPTTNWVSVVVGVSLSIFSAMLAFGPGLRAKLRRETKVHTLENPQLALSIFSSLAVDREVIEKAFKQYGTKWPSLEVRWPQTSNEILENVEACLIKLDSWPTFSGKAALAKGGARAVAKAKRARTQAAERVRTLVSKLGPISAELRVEAVQNFLLLLNYEVHADAASHLMWPQVVAEGHRLSEGWLQLMSSERRSARVATLIGESALVEADQDELVRVRVVAVQRQTVFGDAIYLSLPASALAKRNRRYDADFVSRWLVPQFELHAIQKLTGAGYLPDAIWEFEDAEEESLRPVVS